MKKIISFFLVFMFSVANAQVAIQNRLLGPGVNNNGYSLGFEVYNDLFFVPQFLPGFPTAATLWPRVIRARCDESFVIVVCDGYDAAQMRVRGEYLYFVPEIQKPILPAMTKEIIEIQKPIIIYKEVEKKRIAQ